VKDEYGNYPNFLKLVEVNHGYHTTALQWHPSTASGFAWSQRALTTGLISTTADPLRVFEFH
jgi:DDB1- and CUL4-associated factor 7